MSFRRAEKLSPEDEELKATIRELRDDIVALRKQREPKSSSWAHATEGRNFCPPQQLKLKKTLCANTGPVSTIDFGADFKVVLLASGAKAQGVATVFDSRSGNVTSSVKLENTWKTSVGLEKTVSRLLAVGGLDNSLTLYDLNNLRKSEGENCIEPLSNLVGHDALVTDTRFIDRNEIITASADMTLKLWDIEKSQIIASCFGHTGDMFCCDISPAQDKLVLTGAGDFTARLWDLRVPREDKMRTESEATFDTQSRDVSGIKFFPDGNVFATALNNSCVYLYDIRASCRMLNFRNGNADKSGAEQVEFSSSGRLMFVRYNLKTVDVFDVVGPTTEGKDGEGVLGPESHATLESKQVEDLKRDVNGNVLGVGVYEPTESQTLAHLFWPTKKSRN